MAGPKPYGLLSRDPSTVRGMQYHRGNRPSFGSPNALLDEQVRTLERQGSAQWAASGQILNYMIRCSSRDRIEVMSTVLGNLTEPGSPVQRLAVGYLIQAQANFNPETNHHLVVATRDYATDLLARNLLIHGAPPPTRDHELALTFLPPAERARISCHV